MFKRNAHRSLETSAVVLVLWFVGLFVCLFVCLFVFYFVLLRDRHVCFFLALKKNKKKKKKEKEI